MNDNKLRLILCMIGGVVLFYIYRYALDSGYSPIEIGIIIFTTAIFLSLSLAKHLPRQKTPPKNNTPAV